jgi:hypothetical protein
VEADWSVEIGPDLPRIVVPWSDLESDSGNGPGSHSRSDGPEDPCDAGSHSLRFVDLRSDPPAIEQIEEARRYPGLKRALTALNSPGSPVFSSKCDVFQITKEEIDPLEYDADSETDVGLIYYIDLVMQNFPVFGSFSAQEIWLRKLVSELREHAQVRSARIDFVLRPATVFAHECFAVTCYIAACGRDFDAAQLAWEPALDAVLRAFETVRPTPPPFPDGSV